MHHWMADLHLSHGAVIRHDNRPFNSLEEHDRAIAERCRPEEPGNHHELWLLGDIAWSRSSLMEFLKEISPHWSKIHLIRGNHDDKVAWKNRDLFDSANEALYLRISPEVRVYMSHYAHRTWRNSHHGSYHVHGHSHGALPDWGRSMDVGVMLHDYRPVSERRMVELLRGREEINHHVLPPSAYHSPVDGLASERLALLKQCGYLDGALIISRTSELACIINNNGDPDIRPFTPDHRIDPGRLGCYRCRHTFSIPPIDPRYIYGCSTPVTCPNCGEESARSEHLTHPTDKFHREWPYDDPTISCDC